MAAGMAKKRLIIGIGIIAVALAGLMWVSMREATVYYVTVAEALAQHQTDAPVRISGSVDGASIDYDAQGAMLRFTLEDGAHRLPVLYRGAQPDMLRDGATAVVEGMLNQQGVFEAQDLMLQCPSKYEAEP